MIIDIYEKGIGSPFTVFQYLEVKEVRRLIIAFVFCKYLMTYEFVGSLLGPIYSRDSIMKFKLCALYNSICRYPRREMKAYKFVDLINNARCENLACQEMYQRKYKEVYAYIKGNLKESESRFKPINAHGIYHSLFLQLSLCGSCLKNVVCYHTRDTENHIRPHFQIQK